MKHHWNETEGYINLGKRFLRSTQPPYCFWNEKDFKILSKTKQHNSLGHNSLSRNTEHFLGGPRPASQHWGHSAEDSAGCKCPHPHRARSKREPEARHCSYEVASYGILPRCSLKDNNQSAAYCCHFRKHQPIPAAPKCKHRVSSHILTDCIKALTPWCLSGTFFRRMSPVTAHQE